MQIFSVSLGFPEEILVFRVVTKKDLHIRILLYTSSLFRCVNYKSCVVSSETHFSNEFNKSSKGWKEYSVLFCLM